MSDQQRKGIVAGLLLLLVIIRSAGPSAGGAIAPGSRDIVLVYESQDNSPAFARMVLDLRDGEAAKYIAERKHTLTVIDRDTPDPDGARSKLLAKWQAEITETPVVLVIDSGRLRGKAKIDRDGTSAAVIDVVKRYGG